MRERRTEVKIPSWNEKSFWELFTFISFPFSSEARTNKVVGSKNEFREKESSNLRRKVLKRNPKNKNQREENK